MTSDTEARAEEELATPAPSGEPVALDNSNALAALFLRASLVFLALGLIDALLLAAKRVAPDFLGDIAFLSYGRVVPAMTTLLLYGWLTIGLLGALLYVVPRTSRRDIEDRISVLIGLGLLVVAYLGGALAVLFGYTEGRRYLESPLVVDLVALVGLVLVARAIGRAARAANVNSPVLWYAVAAVVWLVLGHFVGNWPGLGGFTGQLQTSFYRAALIGLWFAPASISVIYYAAAKLAGRPYFEGSRLSVLGIWSLGLTWAMTAPAELTFGVAGDWLETIGVIFSIVLFLPLLVIATDLTHSMRGGWSNVRDRTSLRYVLGALAMFGLFAVFNLIQALRASSAVIGFTDWVAAVETLVLFGPFTFALVAAHRLAAPDLGGGHAGHRLWAYRTTLTGLVVTIGAMAIAGLQTGFTWAGIANSPSVPMVSNVDGGWITTALPLQGNYVVQLVGLAILAAGLMWSLVGATIPGEDLAVEPIEPGPTEPDLALVEAPSLRKVRRYAYGFFALAALMVFLLPALEREEPTINAERNRTFEAGELGAAGRNIYIQEGCTYCHTQQVRPIITDVGLGPVSVLGDYANETPILIGVQRYGPDLMHFAARAGSEGLGAHLQNPRQDYSWSIMPSYSYLSSDDIAALTAYLIPEE